MIVVDASAAAHYLVGPPVLGQWVEELLVADGDVHAPHLIDLEVANALRRLLRGGYLAAPRARAALDALGDFAVTRHPHAPFLDRIWQLRANLSAYDAAYVALAEALRAPLVTTDERLARAPGVRAAILTP